MTYNLPRSYSKLPNCKLKHFIMGTISSTGVLEAHSMIIRPYVYWKLLAMVKTHGHRHETSNLSSHHFTSMAMVDWWCILR